MSDSQKPANTFCRRTRREFLWQAGAGFTGLALVGLLDGDGFFAKPAFGAHKAAASLNPEEPRFAQLLPKAKRVIFLFMYGGPSHADSFDCKTKLYEMDGPPI